MPKRQQTVKDTQLQLERSQKQLKAALDDLKHQPTAKGAIEPAEAKQLCTEDEYEFYRSCQPSKLRDLGIALLQQREKSVSNMCGAYQDLVRRQKLEARDSHHTERKAQMFADILERVKNELALRGEIK